MAQKMRSKTTTASNVKQTAALCKNMTKLCLSAVLSARNLLDDRCFSSKTFAKGMQTDQIDCEEKGGGARKGDTPGENESLTEGFMIQKWIEKGVFEAIEKGYLKSLSFIVAKMDGDNGDMQDELGENTIENYTFKYEYAEDGECLMSVKEDKQVAAITRASMLDQAKAMIRNLVSFNESLPELPGKRTIVLKLKYNQTAPDDYEPQYFRPASAESYSRFVSNKKKRVTLGNLDAKSHSMSLSFTGANWLFEGDSDDDEIEDDEPVSQGSDGADSNDDGLVDSLPGGVLDNEEALEVATQPQEAAVPAPSTTPTPQHRTRSSSGIPNMDTLGEKFGKLGTVTPRKQAAGRSQEEEDVDESVEEPLEDIHDADDDDDDDRTRLDDDSSTRCGGDDEDEDLVKEFPSFPAEAETVEALLKHLRTRTSAASVGVLVFVVNQARGIHSSKLDEVTITTLLEKMEGARQVARKGANRWYALRSGDNDTLGTVQETEIESFSQSAPSPPPPPRKRRQEEVQMDDDDERYTPRGGESHVPGDTTQRSEETQYKPPASDFDSIAGDNDLGDTSLSQHSDNGLSQGRSRYSVVERPIHQTKKSKKNRSGPSKRR